MNVKLILSVAQKSNKVAAHCQCETTVVLVLQLPFVLLNNVTCDFDLLTWIM